MRGLIVLIGLVGCAAFLLYLGLLVYGQAFGNGSPTFPDAFGIKGFFWKALFVGFVGIVVAQVGAAFLQSTEKTKQPRTHIESRARNEASKNDDAIYCSQCGNPSKATAKYCSKCGTALAKDDPA